MNDLRSAFAKVTFQDFNHSYYHEKLGKLESLTRVLSQYMPEFREKYWLAHAVAKQMYGEKRIKSDFSQSVEPDHITVDGHSFHYSKFYERFKFEITGIKAEWRAESKFGKDKGKFVHNHLELLAYNKRIPINNYPDKVKPFIEATENFYEEYKEDLRPLATETVVYSEEFEIAGMFDNLSTTRILWDFKTDKRMEYPNPFANFKNPLNTFEASNKNKHYLQVNGYKYMIEACTDIKVKKCLIVNIQESGFKVYEVPDLTIDVLRLFNHYKMNKS